MHPVGRLAEPAHAVRGVLRGDAVLVGELGDGVAHPLVDRALGDLAAVQVHDPARRRAPPAARRGAAPSGHRARRGRRGGRRGGRRRRPRTGRARAARRRPRRAAPVTGSASATTRQRPVAPPAGPRARDSAVHATPVSTVRSRSGALGERGEHRAERAEVGPGADEDRHRDGAGGGGVGRASRRPLEVVGGAPATRPRRRRARCARRAPRDGAAPPSGRSSTRSSAVSTAPGGEVGAPRASCAARGARSPPPTASAAWCRRRARGRGHGTAVTYVASASGSREAAWSGPGRVRSVVTCFSSTEAPSATAPRALVSPVVWSDQPTGRPWAAPSAGMARRLHCVEGRGVGRDAVEEHGARRRRARLDGRGDLVRPSPCRWRRAAAPRSRPARAGTGCW